VKSIIEQSAAAGMNPVVHAAKELGYRSVDDFLDEMARKERVRPDMVETYKVAYGKSLENWPEIYVPYFARHAIECALKKLVRSTIDPDKLDPKVKLKLVSTYDSVVSDPAIKRKQKPKMIRRFGVGGKR
jgi:hypothetical protein